MKQKIHLASNHSLSEMLAMRYFCANVTHLRMVDGMTKQQLSQYTGLSVGTIASIENNKDTEKMISVAITLAALFRVPIQHLLWTDLSYLPAVKDRFAIEFEPQLGPIFAGSAISNIGTYREEQLGRGVYNRDQNR